MSQARVVDAEIRLEDGRLLGYRDIGPHDGVPVFFFHGIPGSRACMEHDPLLDEFGIRLVLPERPGCGRSDPKPGRSIADWAEDVATLADALGIGRFHAAGGSGGGPYALACGLHLPGRVRSVTLVSSAAPPDLPNLARGMAKGNRQAFFLARRFPCLLRLGFRLTRRLVERNPERLMQAIIAQLCDWDKAVLTRKDEAGIDARSVFLAEQKEAYRQGHQGVSGDFLLVARPWGLDLASLAVPVFLWHGEEDTLVPVAPARALAALLPGCEAEFIPEAGHLLLENEAVGRRILQKIIAI